MQCTGDAWPAPLRVVIPHQPTCTGTCSCSLVKHGRGGPEPGERGSSLSCSLAGHGCDECMGGHHARVPWHGTGTGYWISMLWPKLFPCSDGVQMKPQFLHRELQVSRPAGRRSP